MSRQTNRIERTSTVEHLFPHSSSRRREAKDERERIAVALHDWLWEVSIYYHPSNWTFRVNNKGEYLDGTCLLPNHKPQPFHWKSTTGHIIYTIDRLRHPNNANVLRDHLQTVHQHVTTALWQLIGATRTNKLLEDFRRKRKLPKLRNRTSY